MIHTIGYTGIAQAYLKALVDEHDTVLIDVRLKPFSSNREFNRSALTAALGDRYIWAEGLGNLNYKSDGPIELADPEPWYERIKQMSDRGQNVILMCVCRDVRSCHRSVIADELRRRHGLEVEHHQPRRERDGRSGQASLF